MKNIRYKFIFTIFVALISFVSIEFVQADCIHLGVDHKLDLYLNTNMDNLACWKTKGGKYEFGTSSGSESCTDKNCTQMEMADPCFAEYNKYGTVSIKNLDDKKCQENKVNQNLIASPNKNKNYDKDAIVSCGDDLITDMPKIVPQVIHTIYMVLLVLVPILLVVFGSIDFVKAIIASKEDEIRKGQQLFIKRLISAIIVFFVFVIVKFVISVAADNKANILECASCIINNDENCVGG